ncbi:hypothetical protein B296_00053005 [Ensete ventricosum]|uniref:Uncharacterized protein n=1 Tax=Ensete ventricosum TaxID=4639 RepID=A0A426X5D1_ENSVE|nr:hypothetical protein B296_00053005 [Ensete ventricosum]
MACEGLHLIENPEFLLDSGTKDFSIPKLGALTTDASLSKEAIAKASPLDELKETMELVDDSRRTPAEGDSERTKTRDHDSRGRDSGYDGRGPRDREREKDIERESGKERRHSGKDKGSVDAYVDCEGCSHNSKRDSETPTLTTVCRASSWVTITF